MRKAKPHTSLQTIYISLRGHYINGTRARRKYISIFKMMIDLIRNEWEEEAHIK